MFKSTEVEQNERNKSTYRSANKSLFKQNSIPLFLAVSPMIVMQTCWKLKMYRLGMCKILEW